MLVYAVVALSVVNHSVFGGARVSLSLFALHLGASAFVVGTLMALIALLPMILAISAGRLTDRIGVRTPMIASCVTLCIGTLTPWLLPTLPGLYVSSALVGIAFMMFQVATQHLVGAVGDPRERPRNFAILALGMSLSAMIGPLLAGLTIDRWGHLASFAVLGVLPLAPLLALARYMRIPDVHVPQQAEEGRNVADLLREPQLRRAFIASGLLAMGWDLHQFFIPIYGNGVGLSASQIGTILAAFAAATFVVRLLVPWMLRHLTQWTILTAAMLLSASTYFFFPLTREAGALMFLSFVLGLGIGAGQPLIMALLHDVVPAGRAGEAMGLRTSIINSTHVFLPLLFGAIGSTIGMTPVFWSVGTFLAAGGMATRRATVR